MLQGKVNIDSLIPMKAVDHCVIFFNQAVLLYHLKQYDSALKIMNKVFTFVEPMGNVLLTT
jgi:CCR4-NOT transcription complex subunit 10